MNNRLRIISTALCRETDRPPFFCYFGPWPETLERWYGEGLPRGANWENGLGFDVGIAWLDINLGYCPWFEPVQLEDRGNKVVFSDEYGITQMVNKSGASLPFYLDYPVKNRQDWQKLKKRLDPDSPERFPIDWKETTDRLNRGDQAVQLGNFPWGLFGTLREMMGVENLLLAFYDDPELIHDMMNYLTDFWLAIYDKACRNLKPDIIHIWEDMSGKTGPLISPLMIRKFMLPNYRRIREFADRHGIPVLSLDTDGDCRELAPLYLESGINLLMPFEVAAGCDVNEYRRIHPDLGIMGGIDKREIALGKAAIDRELARIRPMFDQGGYFPMLDHLVHPEISWEDFLYFIMRLKEMTGA